MLNNQILNLLGVEFQSDKDANGATRYWKKAPEEVAKVLNDQKRLAAMLKTFLPDYIGPAEPSSRNLCIFYTPPADNLKRALAALIGFDPKPKDEDHKLDSYNSYKILHVGFDVDTVFSSIINNKFIKSYKKEHVHEYRRQYKRKNLCAIGAKCRNLKNILFVDLDNAGSSSFLQAPKNVGNVGNGDPQITDNPIPASNPTMKKTDENKNYDRQVTPHNDTPENNPTSFDDSSRSQQLADKKDNASITGLEEKYQTLHDKVVAEGMDKNPIPYANVDTVLKTLKEYGFEVMEYEQTLYGPQDTWKAQLRGSMDMFTAEQQDALLSGFKIISPGDVFNKNTWIQFKVRTDSNPPAGPDKPEKPAGENEKHSDDSGIESIIMTVLKGIAGMTHERKIALADIIKSWPVTSKIPVPSLSNLYEKILPTMAGDGIIKLANGQIELPSGGD